MLGLKYSELSWEMAKPSDEGNPDCLPCLFLQFPVRENGTQVYKILQVFSKQVRILPMKNIFYLGKETFLAWKRTTEVSRGR